jgi:low temperature requirement protein LtrA
MGVFSHVYKRPRPNQSWNAGNIVTHHEEETWLQLFIDLIYVAFFMSLGKGIAYCEVYENEKESDVLGAAGLLFLILFGLRYDIDMYANRFHSRDVCTRCLYFVFTCGVVIMSLHIYKTNSVNSCPLLGLQAKAELVGFIVAYFAIVCLNGIAIYKNPTTQPQLGLEYFFSLFYLIFSLVCVGPIEDGELINFFRVTVPLNYLLRIEFLGQYIRPYFNKHLGPHLFVKNPGPLELERDVIPLNVHAHQVRLCMFVMIATGEGMIQLIYPSLPTDDSFVDRIYMFVVACVVILFGLAMLYADAVVRNPHHSDHAMKRDSKLAQLTWTFSHVFLGYFMFLTGITIELAIGQVYENKPIDHAYDTLLGVCIGSATLIMTLMRSTHKGTVLYFTPICIMSYSRILFDVLLTRLL